MHVLSDCRKVSGKPTGLRNMGGTQRKFADNLRPIRALWDQNDLVKIP
jgi:hypothetical protein